jgi:uncharacterized protein YlxW (UPF0749 family)
MGEQDEDQRGTDRRRERPPALHTTGLLDRITAGSLDEDYAHVSERRRQAAEQGGGPQAEPRRPSRRGLTLAVAAAFGALLATAAVQTARTEPIRQESQESLRTQAQERRQELGAARREIVTLRRAVDRVQGDALAASEEGRNLSAQLTELGVAAGTEAATGPGMRIVVDDSPEADSAAPGESAGGTVLDTDLQKLVNGLWVSGAEAVAINGQRLTTLSSIRVAGGAITVNLRSLSRPYVVTALGDPEQLPARFVDSDGGTWWLNLRSVYRLRFDMTTEESLTVPAAPPVALRHARTPRSAR